MSTIHFNEFRVGLDHRKSATVADANRLRELKNAYITTGNVIRKRPGLPKIATLEAGTKGLVSGNGVLNTFYEFGAPVTHADTRFVAQVLEHATGAGYAPGAIQRVHYGTVFLGYLYVAVEYDDGNVFHYYIDGANPNRVTDASCPNSKALVKQESRLWAVDGDTVAYCVLENPKDWSTVVAAATDAGFLGTGLKSNGSADALALGQYDGRLAVFFVDGMQLWDIGTDVLTDLGFYKNVEGIGCKYPKTPTIFAGDVMFLARSGFRSITTQTYTANLTDVDVGSPIDTLVRAEVEAATDPRAAYFIAQNQFWCAYPIPSDPEKTRVWVYSYSKSAKVAAWAKYEVAFTVDDLVVHDGYLHIRSGDDVYRVDETESVYADGGAAFDMEASFAFIDCKTPGVDKYFRSMDITVIGTVQVQFRYDPNDETKLTPPITVTGDTRPTQSIPLEITATALAPVFTSTDSELVQIDAFSFHYDNLGVQ